jgi:hypothetical protein
MGIKTKSAPREIKSAPALAEFHTGVAHALFSKADPASPERIRPPTQQMLSTFVTTSVGRGSWTASSFGL